MQPTKEAISRGVHYVVGKFLMISTMMQCHHKNTNNGKERLSVSVFVF